MGLYLHSDSLHSAIELREYVAQADARKRDKLLKEFRNLVGSELNTRALEGMMEAQIDAAVFTVRPKDVVEEVTAELRRLGYVVEQTAEAIKISWSKPEDKNVEISRNDQESEKNEPTA